LVRQQHFQTVLRTRTNLMGVHWLVSLDMLGIDLLILHRGFALGVALSIRTETAAAWQAIKHGRHPILAGLTMLELDVDPNRAEKVGPFWVHPLSDAWGVQNAMEALMSQSRDALVAQEV
jgi:hypothetical protein